MSDLRELVDEWRECAEEDEARGYGNAAGTWLVAANELEEALDERSTPVKELSATLSLDTEQFQKDVQEAQEQLSELEEQADSVAESLEEIEPPRTNARVYEPYGARNGGITDD